jgi:hypothetical protein
MRQKLTIFISLLFAILFLTNSTSFGQRRYSGSKHTTSHGGHYSNGKGSSHKGGAYKNAKTNNHYGKHKK